jgi:hypothetical protein
MDVVAGCLRQNAVVVSMAARAREKGLEKHTKDFAIAFVRMDSMYYGERKFPFGEVVRKPFLGCILFVLFGTGY